MSDKADTVQTANKEVAKQPVQSTTKTKRWYNGHRARLKRKFNRLDLRTLEDYELLEILLFYVVPRIDTKPLSKALLRKFGTLKGIVTADRLQLNEVQGVGEAAATFFRLLEDVYSRLHLPVGTQVHILNHWTAVLRYCQLTMGQKHHESCRVLYLNRKNFLVADELIQRGTLDKVAIYPREIVRRCVTNGAAAIILVHNHPSGDATPSTEDIAITRHIQTALASIGVVLHDHLIVGGNDCFSLRAKGLLVG